MPKNHKPDCECILCKRGRSGAEAKRGRSEIKRLAEARAFSNYGPIRGAQEVMIHVYWSAVNDAVDELHDRRGHLLQRGKVTADLGLDAVPDPPFTRAEMELITYAAKGQAIKCLRARKRRTVP